MELRAGFLLVFFHLDCSRLANRVLLFSRPKWAGPKRKPPPVNEKGRGSTSSSHQPPASWLESFLCLPGKNELSQKNLVEEKVPVKNGCQDFKGY